MHGWISYKKSMSVLCLPQKDILVRRFIGQIASDLIHVQIYVQNNVAFTCVSCASATALKCTRYETGTLIFFVLLRCMYRNSINKLVWNMMFFPRLSTFLEELVSCCRPVTPKVAFEQPSEFYHRSPWLI